MAQTQRLQSVRCTLLGLPAWLEVGHMQLCLPTDKHVTVLMLMSRAKNWMCLQVAAAQT